MHKPFKTNKRLLSKEEKMIRAIEFYTFDDLDFELEYLPVDDGLTHEERAALDDALDKALDKDDFLEADRLCELHPYIEPQLDVPKNYDKLSSSVRFLVDAFVSRDIFEETITFKCLKCDYEETLDLEIVEESWDDIGFPDYPVAYCSNCNKDRLVPIDIYNKKKLK